MNEPFYKLRWRDHLHLRGEYKLTYQFGDFERGSPPLAWRILSATLSATTNIRITSTSVENTFHGMTELHTHKDHLHIRGEYQVGLIITKMDQGSPPHPWRILNRNSIKTHITWITSTSVENTHVQTIV